MFCTFAQFCEIQNGDTEMKLARKTIYPIHPSIINHYNLTFFLLSSVCEKAIRPALHTLWVHQKEKSTKVSPTRVLFQHTYDETRLLGNFQEDRGERPALEQLSRTLRKLYGQQFIPYSLVCPSTVVAFT